MPSVSVPSVIRLVDEMQTLPNAVLEKAFDQARGGGIIRFGARCPVHPEITEEIRNEINRRNRNGNYIFANRTEHIKLMQHRPSVPKYGTDILIWNQ